MSSYRLIEHTADLGMEFFGHDMKELFISAAEGLFDEITEREGLSCKERFEIEVDGSDREDLLINWLREILYLHQVKGMLLKGFSISEINDTHLGATVEGEAFDTGRHIIKREVKAATYHELFIWQEKGQWTARVIFDL